ncbi:MAG: helix-turn-helix transcriptional regulator [Alphaproteobacteria bacterium]|nr:helix-turn-helix transcriptional regulator [Alphaproteobacteria bacterium]
MHSYVEASFAALSQTQLSSSYSKLAAELGYSATFILDSAKLETAFASSIVFSTLHKPVLTAFDAKAPVVSHPLTRLAGEIDAPFSIHDACELLGLSELEMRRDFPAPIQDAELVIFPVHRRGKLALLVSCSGNTPDQTAAGRALLHTGAHVLYDRYASIGEVPQLPPRQADCLFWAAQGKTYAQIGEFLGLSTRTVRAALAKAKRSLNARTKAEAIALAVGRNAG